jgi:DNA-binding NarL/FixJ family response regulator
MQRMPPRLVDHLEPQRLRSRRVIPPAALAVMRAALEDALVDWDIHPAPEPAEPLHPRQGQILLGWARGWTDQAIAAELGLSLNTVKTHGRRLRPRLGATCRAHAVAIGYETGLLQHGDVTTGRRDNPTPRSTT